MESPVLRELLSATATELARLVRERQVSAVELVRASLHHIDATHGQLNAVVARCDVRAEAEARSADAAVGRGEPLGPLHGVPITIKDSHDTQGLVTTGGTLGRAGHIPAADSPPVARLRAAGAIVLGKTNTPELTLSFITDNLVYGRTNHPDDQARTPGGSSGGAAAILAAGGPALELGSDLGGSIRVPAHWCGVCGLKTTRGRVPRTGHILPWGGGLDSYSTIGPMARSVEDLELALALISGPDGCDPFIPPVSPGRSESVAIDGLRVGWFDDNGVQTPHPAIRQGVKAAASALEAAGAHVRPASSGLWVEAWMLASLRFSVDIGPTVRVLLERYGTDTASPQLAADLADPPISWLAAVRRIVRGVGSSRPLSAMLTGVAQGDPAQPLTLPEYRSLLAETDRLRGALERWMADFDVILCPPSAFLAPTHAEAPYLPQSYGNGVNLSGFPACVLPVGRAEGLPVGVQVIARPWHEHVALRAAMVLQMERGR